MNTIRTGSESTHGRPQDAHAIAPAQPEPPPAADHAHRSAGPSGTTLFISGRGSASARSPRKRVKFILGVAVLATLLIFGAYRWWQLSLAWVKTDNAYVAAHVHAVSPRVAGTVQEVFIDENEAVESGSLLAKLDPRDFDVSLQQARAQLERARALREQAEAKLAEAHAQSVRDQARAEKAALDLKRAEALYAGSSGTISKQEYDAAKTEADAAQAAADAAKAGIGSARALVSAAAAEILVAEANLSQAELQLSYTQIRAPAAGRIGKKNLEIGNRVQPGQALVALVQRGFWVTANFKETQLTHVRPGQRVRLRFDAFPGRRFNGTVESLSPASGAQFALLPPDNATGNFTRIVQRVPVKILLHAADVSDFRDRIIPGMSAVVEVQVRE